FTRDSYLFTLKCKSIGNYTTFYGLKYDLLLNDNNNHNTHSFFIVIVIIAICIFLLYLSSNRPSLYVDKVFFR
ncbi:MAG: hypothetical protein ACXWFZ_05235, partial [Nitrososphaeraceae archaeon]